MSINRFAELEARINDLEDALETQAVLLGRLIGMPADARLPWLSQLSRGRRDRVEVSPARKRLTDALLYGGSVDLPPDLDALRFSP